MVLQCLEQCLVHGRWSIIVCGLNEVGGTSIQDTEEHQTEIPALILEVFLIFPPPKSQQIREEMCTQITVI